jgi:hypothetical protein
LSISLDASRMILISSVMFIINFEECKEYKEFKEYKTIVFIVTNSI